MEGQTEKLLEVVTLKQVTRKSKNKFALYQIKSPEDAAIVAHHFIGDYACEVMMTIMLNTKNQVIGIHRFSTGSLNATIAHPRECFKSAILNNAASVILAHQHPSNNPTPSPEDVEVTDRFAEAGKILGIEVLDHVIVTEYKDKYISLKEKGYM